MYNNGFAIVSAFNLFLSQLLEKLLVHNIVIFSAPCGRSFVATNKLQSISSPNYPFQHLPNRWCRYTIQTFLSSRDFLVQLTVLNITDETCCNSLRVREFIRPRRNMYILIDITIITMVNFYKHFVYYIFILSL